MVKYKKLLPGPPYVKTPPLTEGFVPGVGYFRNFIAAKPVWAFCGLYAAITAVYLGIQFSRNPDDLHPDMRLMHREAYKVKRREDVDDPTRECYN